MPTQQLRDEGAAARDVGARRLPPLRDQTVWELGPVLVEACGIRAGQRVLDVAAGTGNVAIRAAEAGAEVVASDLTPENFAAGRARGARRAGSSSSGSRPTPRRCRSATASSTSSRRRSARCSRPTIGGGRRARARVPPGRHDRHGQLHARGPRRRVLRAVRPVHAAAAARRARRRSCGAARARARAVRRRVDSLRADAREYYVERSREPAAYCEFFKETFGPAVRPLREPRRRARAAAALDAEFLEFATRANQRSARRAGGVPYEYLLVVGRT